MLEFIFFNEQPWRRFADRVRERGLEPSCSSGEDGLLVGVPEDIDDALAEGLEAFYDEMMDLDQTLVAESEGGDQVHTAGVSVRLSDGRTILAPVEPALLRRVMEVLSPEEIGRFVGEIADAVEHPDDRPMCRR